MTFIQRLRPLWLAPKITVRTFTIDYQAQIKGKHLEVDWKDENTVSKYSAIWLRHSCTCDLCRYGTSQKAFLSRDALPNYEITNIETREKELTVRWKEDPGHDGIFPLKMLKENSYDPPLDTRSRQPPPLKEPVTEISYPEILNDDKLVLKWLQLLAEQGLVLLKNVPTEKEYLERVVNIIAPLQETIYGKTFDVVATPDPINIAYSTSELELHMDLVYYQSPPGLQLLHCLKFDSCVEGGESFFVDSFHAAEEFRKAHPQDFATLTTIPATFQKVHYERGRPVHMVYRKPHIELNEEGEIMGVLWSPPFEGAVVAPANEIADYYNAYSSFSKWIQKFQCLKFRLKEGDIVSFNNLRILHARNEFTLNGGSRYLHGAYVNIDDFYNEYMCRSIAADLKPVCYHVGNGSH